MLKNSLTYAGAQDQFIDGYLCASIYVHVEAKLEILAAGHNINNLTANRDC